MPFIIRKPTNEERKLMEENKKLRKLLFVTNDTMLKMKKEKSEVELRYITDYNEGNKSLKDALTETKSRLEKERTRRSEEKLKADKTIEELYAQKMDFERKFYMAGAQKLFDKEDTELTDSDTRLIEMIAEKEDLMAQVRNLSLKIEMHKGTIADKITNIEELNKVVEGKNKKIKKMEEMQDKSDQTIAELERKLKRNQQVFRRFVTYPEVMNAYKRMAERDKVKIGNLNTQIVNLKGCVSDQSSKITKMERDLDCGETANKNFQEDVERKDYEISLMSNNIRKMKNEIRVLKEKVTVLEKQDQENKLTQRNMEEASEKLKTELENDLKLERIDNQALRNDKSLCEKNLLIAQEQIQKLQETMTTERDSLTAAINEKDSELDNLKKQCDSQEREIRTLRENLRLEKLTSEGLRRDFAEEKKHLWSAHDFRVSQLKDVGAIYRAFEAEVKVERNQQQLLNNKNKEEITKQAECIKELTINVTRLSQKCRWLKRENLWLLFQKRRKEVPFAKPTKDQFSNTPRFWPSVTVHQHQEVVKKKDEEIANLKAMLARRPDDAVEKYNQCRWDLREEQKRNKESETDKIYYHHLFQKSVKERDTLAAEVRQLRVDLAKETRSTRFPSVVQRRPKTSHDVQSKDLSLESTQTPHISLSVSIHKHQDVVKMKDAEIEKLKAMLARRPADAMEKYYKCSLDLREEQKRTKDLQTDINYHQNMYQKTAKENETLTAEVRQLRVDLANATRSTRFPSATQTRPKTSLVKENETLTLEVRQLRVDLANATRSTRFPSVAQTRPKTSHEVQLKDPPKSTPLTLPPIQPGIRGKTLKK